MWPFYVPTIEVVTFRLRGWCMLGVFLLPAFTRLGHECEDLLSLCDGMHVCSSILSSLLEIHRHLHALPVQNEVNWVTSTNAIVRVRVSFGS